MLDEETIKLLKEAQPDHGIDTAVEKFQKVQAEKKRPIRKEEIGIKYQEWAKKNINENFVHDFHPS